VGVEGECALDPVIGGELRTRPIDEVIAVLAERQHGVVARRQLVALGLGSRAIDHRLECGRLHLLHRGVYSVGHRVLSQRGRWMAAVLACGAGAVLSHRSAAALWGIRPTSRPSVEVTTARRLHARPGLHPHRAVLPADEVTVHDGIPTTTSARTLLDLAAVVPRRTLERALDEAEILRLPGPATLLDRYPRRRGAATLRTLLVTSRSPTPTRTELEDKFLTFVDDWGFDRPDVNTIIEGLEVDAAWRDARLIVELDGFATHGTRRGFERDRKRDRRLTAAGWCVIRLTWRQLSGGAALAHELRTLLTQPRRTSSASPWPPPPHIVATPTSAPPRRI
jgi:predicted transcriptional regulator of viral defense system